jgi:hypothetical protein
MDKVAGEAWAEAKKIASNRRRTQLEIELAKKAVVNNWGVNGQRIIDMFY